MHLVDVTLKIRLAFFCICYLALLLDLALYFKMGKLRLKLCYRCVPVVFFLLLSAMLQIMSELSSRYFEVKDVFFNCRTLPFFSLLGVIILLEILMYSKIRKLIKIELSAGSIKESLDNLPVGVCFSTKDGRPVLVNRAMQELSHAIFGQVVSNTQENNRRLAHHEILENVKIIRREPLLILQAGGETWQLKQLDHAGFSEIIAFNISEKWALLQELSDKNKQLDLIQQRLKVYNQNIPGFIKEKEILAAKVKIHDNIGRSLLALRAYLADSNPTQQKRLDLLSLWQQSLLTLAESSGVDPEQSAWEKLTRAAESVGVTIHRRGDLPAEEAVQAKFLTIVHECLNNAVRHAQAKNIMIEIGEVELKTGPGYLFTISNDGKLPENRLAEKGGLKNIRRSVELDGGEMQMEIDRVFKIRISLPKGRENDL